MCDSLWLVSSTSGPEPWLLTVCSHYTFDGLGVLRADDGHGLWPLTANSADELAHALDARGLLLPLPKEPAALANVLEVGIVDHLLGEADTIGDITLVRGSERGYPDLEISGSRFGDQHYAVDIKVAQRARTKDRLRTQSRITLYTGNTYFRWPNLKWPGTFRPFNDYAGHYDILVIYTLDEKKRERVTDVELIVQEPWRIGSRKRSSTTREYIGAVDLISDLRDGNGEFETAEAFYKFWRAFPFRISTGVQNQLRRLLDSQQAELKRLRATQAADLKGIPSGSGRTDAPGDR